MSEEYTVNRELLYGENHNIAMKPAGITSGVALKVLDNSLFYADSVLTPRTGWSGAVKVDIGCNHEYKRYEGFTDTFEYCTKCQEKKNV